MYQSEEGGNLIKGIVSEVISVGLRKGISFQFPSKQNISNSNNHNNLDLEQVVENATLHVLNVIKQTQNNISSMLSDKRKKRITEIDTINGEIVKLGKELGVETPINRTICTLVKATEKLVER